MIIKDKESENLIKPESPRLISDVSAKESNFTSKLTLLFKKYLKYLIIAFLSLVILYGLRAAAPKDPQSLIESLRSFQQQGTLGKFILILFGISLVLLGLPFLYFELGIGFLCQDFLSACFIVFTAKISAILISYCLL